MAGFRPRVVKGLSLSIGGVLLEAVVDRKNKTVRIVRSGTPINGEAVAIAAGVQMLAGRVRRTMPMFKIVE